MAYLFYDTETTGLPDFKARSHEPTQPHIVQLGLAWFDEEGREIGHGELIVRPV